MEKSENIVTSISSGENEEIPPMDYDNALSRALGDKEFLAELITEYLNIAGTQIESLKSLLEKGDAEAFMSEAHSLKGSSANLSVEKVREIASRLEHMGKEKDLKGAEKELDSLEREINRLTSYIKGLPQ